MNTIDQLEKAYVAGFLEGVKCEKTKDWRRGSLTLGDALQNFQRWLVEQPPIQLELFPR